MKISEIENVLKKNNKRTKLINWSWTIISETKINSETQNRKYLKIYKSLCVYICVAVFLYNDFVERGKINNSNTQMHER